MNHPVAGRWPKFLDLCVLKQHCKPGCCRRCFLRGPDPLNIAIRVCLKMGYILIQKHVLFIWQVYAANNFPFIHHIFPLKPPFSPSFPYISMIFWHYMSSHSHIIPEVQQRCWSLTLENGFYRCQYLRYPAKNINTLNC